MISITRTKWEWRGAPLALKLGTRVEDQETRIGEDFGFPISELCAREGVQRVILGHTDGSYSEYEMMVTDEDGVEPENLEDYDEEEVPGSE